MKFCDDCDTRMIIGDRGYQCPKCGNSAPIILDVTQQDARPVLYQIDVVDRATSISEKVSQRCPRCPNNQAFHWYSYSSGEHAGVKQDRIVEHFRCTQCQYVWAESR